MEKYVYKITNLINNKNYIGQSADYQRRFKEHCVKHTDYVSLINQAILKYGQENFTIEPIYYGLEYNEKEKFFIQYYNTMVPNGYNIAAGGEDPPSLLNGKYSGSNITYDMVSDIIKDLKECKNIAEVQNKYSQYITAGQINKINNGVCWKREDETYPISTHYSNKIDKNDIEPIIQEILYSNKTLKEIGVEYGYCKSTIVNINQGEKIPYKLDGYDYPLRPISHLTKDQVDEIIDLLINTNIPLTKIGELYHKSSAHISSINIGRVYKHNNLSYPLRRTCNDYPSEGE